METKYFKRSQVTGKIYDYFSDDVVRIGNLYQSMAYISNGGELLDIYTSRNRRTNDPILIFVFDRGSVKELYDLWCKHELKIKCEEDVV